MTTAPGPSSGRLVGPAPATDRQGWAALATLVVVLAIANITRSAVVPGRWHFVFNLGVGLSAFAIAVAAGLDRADLGLDRRHVRAGVRLGSVAFVLTSTVVLVGGLTGVVSDGRTDVTLGQMLLRTLVVIPLATVLTEEIAFRGALHGLLQRVLPPGRTIVAGAVLFGLWHVFPTWRGGEVDAGGVEVDRALAAAGTFVATTAAGLGFVWLRVRSGSLVAPILLHLATNSVTFAVAWWLG